MVASIKNKDHRTRQLWVRLPATGRRPTPLTLDDRMVLDSAVASPSEHVG